MIRLDFVRASLLVPTLAALGCAGAAPLPHPVEAPIVAAATISSDPPIVAAATIVSTPVASVARVAFPADWVRGETAPLTASKTLASLILGPQRPPVAPIALRLTDLPVVETTPEPEAAHPPGPNVLSPGEPSREIFIAAGCSRASVRNHAVGNITIGWTSLPIAPQSGGGVQLGGFNGGDGRNRYTSASWNTLDREPKGALRYRETSAWFDMITCKAFEVRHVEVVAQPIAGGLGYAFRTHCPSCKPADVDQLHLITPGGGWGDESFDHRALSLGPGTSITRVFSMGNSAIRRFRAIGSITSRVADAELGLEIVQGIGEAEPTAMIYVTDPPPSRF